jgi:hypothetical protein
LPWRRRFDAVFPETPVPGARDMRLDSGRLQSVLHYMQDARRMTRSEIQIRHEIPCVLDCSCSTRFPLVAENRLLATLTRRSNHPA